jgi:hypothetical protein
MSPGGQFFMSPDTRAAAGVFEGTERGKAGNGSYGLITLTLLSRLVGPEIPRQLS